MFELVLQKLLSCPEGGIPEEEHRDQPSQCTVVSCVKPDQPPVLFPPTMTRMVSWCRNTQQIVQCFGEQLVP